MNQNEHSMDTVSASVSASVVSAPIILPSVPHRKYTDTHLDDCREEYSEEFSETYVHPPLSQYPNLLDSTDLNTPFYQTNHIPFIEKEERSIWYYIKNLCC